MKRSFRSCSSSVPRSERHREKRTRNLSRHEQLRQLLEDLLPAVIADIIELYAARPHVGAFDEASHSIRIFTGDWASPLKLILLEPRRRLYAGGLACVCEFMGALVLVASRNREWVTILADSDGNLQESTISSGSSGILVQFQGKLYMFGSTHFAVFDNHAKCFLPDIELPPGYSWVTNVCVFKDRLFLLLFKNGSRPHLISFDSNISKWNDEGTFPEAYFWQMCANDKNIFFYGLERCRRLDCRVYTDQSNTSSDPCCWGLLITWSDDTGFSPAERVPGVMRLITCDNDHIYFVNHFNVFVTYDIATKQLTPDPHRIEDIEDPARMVWFDVSSSTIF